MGDHVSTYGDVVAGSSMSIRSFVRLGSTFTVSGDLPVEQMISAHGFGYVGSRFSVFDHAMLGSTLSLRALRLVRLCNHSSSAAPTSQIRFPSLATHG